MNLDAWNEAVNGEKTYKRIAETLISDKSCILGWTDEEYDHRDILFTYMPRHIGGELQRGLRWCYLYVSIMGQCSMGFLIENNRDNRKHSSYIKEKLMLNDNHCDDKICELVNGVIFYLDNLDERLK